MKRASSGSTACSASTPRVGGPLGGRRHPDRGGPRAAARGPLRAVSPDRSCRRRGRGGGRSARADRRRRTAGTFLGQRRVRAPVPRRDTSACRPGDARVPRPAAARRRSGAARAQGRAGARFPWESAAVGRGRDSAIGRATRRGEAIRSSPAIEEHIVADVAWAAAHYIDWTGDQAFAAGPGLRAARARRRAGGPRGSSSTRDGSGHIRGVIGPDEYHARVDDNAYTNVMARWNLRRAADA